MYLDKLQLQDLLVVLQPLSLSISQTLPAWVSALPASTCVSTSLRVIELELLDVVLPSLFRLRRAAYRWRICVAKSWWVAVASVPPPLTYSIVVLSVSWLLLLSLLQLFCCLPLFHYSLLPFNLSQISLSLLLIVIVLQTIFGIQEPQILFWEVTANSLHILLRLFVKHFLILRS